MLAHNQRLPYSKGVVANMIVNDPNGSTHEVEVVHDSDEAHYVVQELDGGALGFIRTHNHPGQWNTYSWRLAAVDGIGYARSRDEAARAIVQAAYPWKPQEAFSHN